MNLFFLDPNFLDTPSSVTVSKDPGETSGCPHSSVYTMRLYQKRPKENWYHT